MQSARVRGARNPFQNGAPPRGFYGISFFRRTTASRWPDEPARRGVCSWTRNPGRGQYFRDESCAERKLRSWKPGIVLCKDDWQTWDVLLQRHHRPSVRGTRCRKCLSQSLFLLQFRGRESRSRLCFRSKIVNWRVVMYSLLIENQFFDSRSFDYVIERKRKFDMTGRDQLPVRGTFLRTSIGTAGVPFTTVRPERFINQSSWRIICSLIFNGITKSTVKTVYFKELCISRSAIQIDSKGLDNHFFYCRWKWPEIQAFDGFWLKTASNPKLWRSIPEILHGR